MARKSNRGRTSVMHSAMTGRMHATPREGLRGAQGKAKPAPTPKPTLPTKSTGPFAGVDLSKGVTTAKIPEKTKIEGRRPTTPSSAEFPTKEEPKVKWLSGPNPDMPSQSGWAETQGTRDFVEFLEDYYNAPNDVWYRFTRGGTTKWDRTKPISKKDQARISQLRAIYYAEQERSRKRGQESGAIKEA